LLTRELTHDPAHSPSLLAEPDRRRPIRYLLALLQPRRSSRAAGAPPAGGRRISMSPSTSTGLQSCRCTRKASLCSPRAECTMIARPSFASSHTRCHIRSRTRAVPTPTKTPGLISSSHRVRCPLSPAGQAVRTSTTTGRPRRRKSRPRRCGWRHPTAPPHPRPGLPRCRPRAGAHGCPSHSAPRCRRRGRRPGRRGA